jgi:hypothetical protein
VGPISFLEELSLFHHKKTEIAGMMRISYMMPVSLLRTFGQQVGYMLGWKQRGAGKVSFFEGFVCRTNLTCHLQLGCGTSTSCAVETCVTEYSPCALTILAVAGLGSNVASIFLAWVRFFEMLACFVFALLFFHCLIRNTRAPFRLAAKSNAGGRTRKAK